MSDHFNYNPPVVCTEDGFSVLARIVMFMRKRYVNGDDFPLTFDQILEQINRVEIGIKMKDVSYHRFILYSFKEESLNCLPW